MKLICSKCGREENLFFPELEEILLEEQDFDFVCEFCDQESRTGVI